MTKPREFWIYNDPEGHNDGVYENDRPLEGCIHIREVSPELDAAYAECEKALEAIMWINECRCDEVYTGRKMHEPNAICGELDEVKEALAALKKARGA